VLASCGGSPPPLAHTSGASEGTDPSLPTGPSEAAPSPDLLAGIKAYDAGAYADARAAFEAATKKNPRDAQASYNLGLSCEKLADKTCAEAAYTAAISIKPDFDTAVAALSSLELDAGRIDDAMQVARAGLAKKPGSAPLHENLGVAEAMKGVDQDAALAQLEAAVKAEPAEPMYHLTLAHWLNAWHIRGAAPHLDVALSAAKDDVSLLASIGFEYRMAGEFDACIKTFDRAVHVKDGGEVRTERAICKVGKKDSPGALADFQAAVAVEPTYAPGHYWLGGRLAQQKRYKEAAAEYAKYLELQPTGSLATQASERMRLAQDAAAHDRGAIAPKRTR
jgi:tetratricopeptide (TPR) repeat protein